MSSREDDERRWGSRGADRACTCVWRGGHGGGGPREIVGQSLGTEGLWPGPGAGGQREGLAASLGQRQGAGRAGSEEGRLALGPPARSRPCWSQPVGAAGARAPVPTCGPIHPTSHRPGSECRSPPHRGGKRGSRRGPGRVSSDPALRPLTPPGEAVRRQTVPLHRFGRRPPSTRQQGRPARPTELSRKMSRRLSALPSTEPLARVACVTERLNFKFS